MLCRCQMAVLYKMAPPGEAPELFGKPGLRRKLRCSLQDRPFPGRPAKPRKRSALGPKLRCSLQGCPRAAADPAGAAADGYARRPRDAFASRPSDIPDAPRAKSCDYLWPPAHRRDRSGSSAGGNRRGGGAGNPPGCKHADGDDRGKAGRFAGSTDSGGSRSMGLLRVPKW